MAIMTPEQAKNLFSHFEEGVNTMEEIIFLGQLINKHAELGDYFYSDRHVTQEVFGRPVERPELAEAS